jgi:hypothetical protein
MELLNGTDKLFILQRRDKPKSKYKQVGRFADLASAEAAQRKHEKDEKVATAQYRVKYETTTRVYRYGLRAPTITKAVDDQIFKGHRYQNKLTEINLASRAEYRALLEEAGGGELEAAHQDKREKEQAVTEIEANIKAIRQRHRARAEPPEMKARLKAAKAERALARATYKVLRDKIKNDAAFQKKAAALNEKTNNARKEARTEARNDGLFWGTYLRREDCAAHAQKGRFDPRYHKWNYGDGSSWCSVQLQNGLSVADAFAGTNRYLQIDPVDLTPDRDDPKVWDTKVRRGERRQRSRTRVRVCIDGTGQQAEFPCELHRPLPADGVIKWAVVIRERVGRGKDRDKWSLHLTIEVPREPIIRRPGVVGVNIGWRLIANSKNDDMALLRVAYWADDKGDHGECLLDEAIWHRDKAHAEQGQLGKAEELRSERDKLFDAARSELRSWLRDRRKQREHIPTWLREGAKGLAKWKSPRRLANLIWKWRDNRFEGDKAVYKRLEGWRKKGANGKFYYMGWRKQDKHLANWEAHARRKGHNRRKNDYRVFAKRLATTYGTVVVTKMDYADAARRARPGEKDELHEAARRQRVVAAPSRLVDAIRNACSTHGAEFNELPVRTDWCHICDTPNNAWADKKARAEDHEHTCVGCGNLVDQDHNAAEIVRRVWAATTQKKGTKAA